MSSSTHTGHAHEYLKDGTRPASPLTLGERVTDRVTGFTGIATGRSEYLYSSPRVEVQAEPLDDGKPRDPVWFDEARLDHASGERVAGFVKADPR